jgi:hypothetical protein
LTLRDGNLEDGGQIDCMRQAKRKSRKRAVTDIDDSVKQTPTENGVTLTFRQVSARWRSEVSFDDKKNTRSNGRRRRKVSIEVRKALEAVERKCIFSPWEKASELADSLCGATLKLRTQSSIDREEEDDRRQ